MGQEGKELGVQEKTPGVHIQQKIRARFHRIVSPVPAVVWVFSGEKRLSSRSGEASIRKGQMVLLPENEPLSVENIPVNGTLYEARVLAYSREIFERAYDRLSISEDRRRTHFQSAMVGDALRDAFLRARNAIDEVSGYPQEIVGLRCEELVVWLARAGALLPRAKPRAVADQVRAILFGDLSRDWCAQEIPASIAMSEATLRRRLRAEKTSFSEVLSESRLSAALSLLQTTNWKVASVAEAVGYSSASRFSKRFKERFEIAPRDLRNKARTATRR